MCIRDSLIATYTNEDGVGVAIDETITSLDTVGQTLVYTDETGTAFVADLTGLETLTVLDTVGQTITYRDEDGITFTADIRDLETLTVIDTVGQTITYRDEDGITFTADIRDLETTTLLTGVQTTGKIIGSYTNEDSLTVDIRETVTTLELTGNDLSFTNEDNSNSAIDLSTYLDNTDEQILTYTNTNPDDNVNTLQIEGHSAFNIDDNHLGTDDQTLTAARDINLSGFGLDINSQDGTATFTNTGNFFLNDASAPIIQVEDNRNGVQTRIQSVNTIGIIGTTSAHPLQIRTDNTSVALFDTSGQFRLHSYGSGALSLIHI